MKNIGQEHCEDAISRQAVMEICNEEWDSDLIVERIGQLPSITPQPKTGHWTERKIHKTTGFFLPTCSECGNIQPYTHHTFSWNYCPTCGAKMQEVEK